MRAGRLLAGCLLISCLDASSVPGPEAAPQSTAQSRREARLPDSILERLAAIRDHVGEVVYRTHPARLRMLELRARATQRLLAAPDLAPEYVERKLRLLASDWWQAAAELAAPPGSSRLLVPEEATRDFSPVRPSIELAAITPFSVALRFRIESASGTPWAGPGLEVHTEVSGADWRAIDPLPEGPVAALEEGETWERQVRLECDPNVLRDQAAVPLSVRFAVLPPQLGLPSIEGTLDRLLGDASVLDWRVGGPAPAAREPQLRDEARTSIPARAGEPEPRLPEGWRPMKGMPGGRLDPDPFLIELAEPSSAGRQETVAVVAAPVDVTTERDARIEILATGGIMAYLDGSALLTRQECSLVDGRHPEIHRWTASARLAPGRHIFVLQCSPPTAASIPWRIGACVRDARGDPLLR